MSQPDIRKEGVEGENVDQGTVPAQEPPAPQEEPARIGPGGRLTGVLLSPGETYEDINRKPTWLVPIIIAMVTVLASSLFFNWRANPDWDRFSREQIRKQSERTGQQPSEEQVAQQVAFTKSFAKFFPIIGAVVAPVMYLIVAGLFALGMMLLQAKTTFKKILSVISWTFAATGLVGTIVFAAALMVRDEESLRDIDLTNPTSILPTNLGVLLSADASPVVKALAGSLDLFSIWTIVLLAIGLAAIAGSRKITTGKTGALVVGLWIAYLIVFKVGPAALFG